MSEKTWKALVFIKKTKVSGLLFQVDQALMAMNKNAASAPPHNGATTGSHE